MQLIKCKNLPFSAYACFIHNDICIRLCALEIFNGLKDENRPECKLTQISIQKQNMNDVILHLDLHV